MVHLPPSETDTQPTVERAGMAWPPEEWEAWKREAEADSDAGAGRSLRPVIRQVAETLVLSLVLFGLFRIAFQNYVVESHSMEPTLHEGQRIWVSKLDDDFGDGFHRGDIVVFQAWGQEKPFVKRVVGLPGESVEVRDGRVWIDGEPLAEPYLAEPTSGQYGPMRLAPDQMFVMGDNRGNSADSRTYGALASSDVVGRAWLRYWPLAEAALLTGAHPALAGEQ